MEHLDYKFLVNSALSSSAHLSVSKQAIKIIGLLPAILLADLLSKAEYFSNKGTLDDDGFFFSEQSYIKEDLGLSEYHQKNAVNKLVELELIESKRVGIPPRIWYKINYVTVFTNILNFSDIKTKNLIYNNKNKGNILSKESKRVSPSVSKDDLFLLEEWRKFKHIPTKQLHTREGTKVHLKISNLTKWLLNGTFINHCDLKQEFLQPLGLTKAKLNRKYSKDELLSGLDEMAEMFKENNLPEDKTKICNMGFDQLLYHPMAKISYLIKYMYSDHKELTYKMVEVYDHWLERVYKEGLFERDIENDNYQFGLLKKGLAGIEDYHDWLIENVHPIPTQIRKQDQFFNTYIEWVLNNSYDTISVHSIGTNNGKWYHFIKWLEEAIYGDYVGSSPSLDRRKY